MHYDNQNVSVHCQTALRKNFGATVSSMRLCPAQAGATGREDPHHSPRQLKVAPSKLVPSLSFLTCEMGTRL